MTKPRSPPAAGFFIGCMMELSRRLRDIISRATLLHRLRGAEMAEDLTRITADVEAIEELFKKQIDNNQTLANLNAQADTQIQSLTSQVSTLQAQLTAAQGADNQPAIDALADRLEALAKMAPADPTPDQSQAQAGQ